MNEPGILLHLASLTGLPVPVALYIYMAANVVVLSFVPAALFSGDRRGSGAVVYPRVRAPWLLALGRSPAVRVAGGLAGVLGLAAILGAGAAGRLPAPYVLWTWLWAALVPLSALAGSLWPLVNPWAAIHDAAARLARWTPPFTLPAGAGVWPAAAAYLGFALVALAASPDRPTLVPLLLAGYTVVTLAGMACFGRDEWLTRCEAFTALFSVVGRFGPVEAERDADGRLVDVWLRPWGTGLLQRQRGGWRSFLLVLLSTLAFDGLAATGPWQAVAPALGPAAVPLGLLAVTAVFLAVIDLFVRLVLAAAGARRRRQHQPDEDDANAGAAFTLTLVPIALLYHTALSWGFVLAGLRAALPVRAEAIWYVQLTLVVLGHAIAVYLAHARAGERFRSARRAMLGQYPMVVLLALYTMTSMWILAQPTTAVQ
jgi:hypothetical protein